MSFLRGRSWLIVVFSGMVSCSPDPLQDGRCLELKSLPGRNAKADAAFAFRGGDKRILMLGGLVGEFPGAGNYRGPYRMLEGTADATTQACRSLRKRGASYVERYNREMISLLSGIGS